MVMQSGLGLPREETIGCLRSLINEIVDLGRIGGERRITDIRVHGNGRI